MERTVYLCEDSLDGILTAVYKAYEEKRNHDTTVIELEGETRDFFSEYRVTTVDIEKAYKVARTIYKKMGEELFSNIWKASCANRAEKANAIYKTIVLGLVSAHPHKIMEQLGNTNVRVVFELARRAGNEAHHLLGFIRFQELSQGILYSEIKPENAVLPLLSEHFSDRYPNENFIIGDERRLQYLVHQAGKPCEIITSEQLDRNILLDLSGEEKGYQKLWKAFCESISVKERRNVRLQNNNLPKRFQKNMVEFR